MGRRSAAHHARREVSTYVEFATEFEQLSEGLNTFLDTGDFEAFTGPLYALEDHYDGPLPPLDPDSPRGERLREYARRYARATLTKTYLLSIQRTVQDRIDNAHAQMVATAAEPADMPQYWQKLVASVRADGIRAEDIHPGSRALAKHIAAAIREFNAGEVPPADETYSDAPLSSWADLPREFSGFRLIDIDPDDTRLVLPHFICPLPTSTDIAFYTVDRVAPPLGCNRHNTYKSWISIIEEWAKRTNRTLHDQQPPIWAMLLANRLSDDGSKVGFFDGRMIESPWERGGIVMVEIVEDDLPEGIR